MINDRYKIIKKAGEGRSKVFLCTDILRRDTEIAIKILPCGVDKAEENSFRDEFYLLSKLNHSNIISVYEFGTILSLDEYEKDYGIAAGSYFFTLEYFNGKELYEFPEIHRESSLEKIICEIASVLYYLHQSAFIYYDLKSENILVKNINNRPVIKFIDFGLTLRAGKNSDADARGTAEYIAPEILKNENIDHRVDLYSFGILLYRIIYGVFPFETGNQFSIYKSHLEKEYEFPESNYSNKIITLTKRLLSKDVEKRHYTSVGILEEFDPANIKNYKREWMRIPVFAGRSDSLSTISTYIEKEGKGEVLIIKGSEGAGKSTLLTELHYKYKDSVLITAEQNNENYLWQSLLRKILYEEKVYSGIDNDTIEKGKEILDGRNQNLLEDLKALFVRLTSSGGFILLIDDFNLLNDFDFEIFLQIIPLLQVNKIKIVITEDSAGESKSSRINNLQFINLNPFTEVQVSEFVNKSFAGFFPCNEIRKTIILYSDLLPGNIEVFLKDLIVLNLLKFFADGPVMNVGADFDKILKSSQEEIYQLRLDGLDEDESDMAILLSIFNINIDLQTISGLTGKTRTEIISVLEKLSEANIIHQSTILNSPLFTSHGIKEYIYSTIKDKKQAHSKIADLVLEIIPEFDRNELARHLEIAGEYEKIYFVLQPEIEKAEKASALAYKKGLLQYLLKFPLRQKINGNVKKELSNCLFQLGELNACLELVNELLKLPSSKEDEIELKILKGNALIVNQSVEDGKEILKSVLNEIRLGEKRNEILAEIADAEIQLFRYDEAEKIIEMVLNDSSTSILTKGKIFRVKGLMEFYNNNPVETIKSFEKSLLLFKEKQQLSHVAATENNLANIYHMLRDGKKAEEHWSNALKINSLIGDVQRQGGILINFGIFYFNICNFDLAIEQYQKAKNILMAFGDKNYLGFNYTNLGEVYLVICDYEKAISSIEQSVQIFNEIGINYEKYEAQFILGKVHFELEQRSKLQKVLSEFEKNLKSEDSEKLSDKYNYLKLLSELLNNNYIENVNEFYETRDKLKVNSDNFNYCSLEILLIENFIFLEKFDNALNELNNSEFLDISADNIYFKAYRNYLLGKISGKINNAGLEPAINYYIRAYEEIKEISITDLTLRILLSLYEVYEMRGNISKKNEYANYLNYLISYIAGQINDSNLREAYLKKKNINEILSKLNTIS